MTNVIVHTKNTYFNNTFASRWAMAQWIERVIKMDVNEEITKIELIEYDGSKHVPVTTQIF